MSEPKKTLVEGLKVEEGQVLNGELFDAIQTVCAWEQDYRTRNNLGPKPPDCFIWLATLAAQHLKREQEPASQELVSRDSYGPDGKCNFCGLEQHGGDCREPKFTSVLQELWTWAVGREGYDKKKWQKLEKQLVRVETPPQELEELARKFLHLPELKAAWTPTQTTTHNVLVEFAAALTRGAVGG